MHHTMNQVVTRVARVGVLALVIAAGSVGFIGERIGDVVRVRIIAA